MVSEKSCVACGRMACTKRYKDGCDGRDYTPLTEKEKDIRIKHHVIKEAEA